MKSNFIPAIATTLACACVSAEVQLPNILSSGMVLQRETSVSLWGWARPDETVKIEASWPNGTVETKGDADGRWRVMLPTPGAGGPHTIKFSGENSITLSDVMIGEVWVCSGQSNMEWPLKGIGPGREDVPSAEDEIRNAKYPAIRLFTVANVLSAAPRSDVTGKWAACSPETARDFSAVGYFFARDVQMRLANSSQEKPVPIGMISADWGGTPAEAWTSEEGLAAFPEFGNSLQFLRAVRDPGKRGTLEADRVVGWWSSLDALGDKPVGAAWKNPGFDDSKWKSMKLPTTLGPDGLNNFDGVLYFRRTIQVPEAWAGKAATLELGPIDDRDETFLNGELAGATREDGRWGVARKYPIGANMLKPGPCVIAVRMLDTAGPGGINGSPDQMVLRCEDPSVAPIPLAGDWKYWVGPTVRQLPPMPDSVNISQHTPSVLYNGMIAPITGMTIRGVIWYQGESNVGRAAQYRTLFPAMIRDWRAKWSGANQAARNHEFPFYYVQIAPFRYTDGEAAALLREAQGAALKLPNTGMVCTLDLGNPSDIHPDNKQQVGRRLAALALNRDYGRSDVLTSGPTYPGSFTVKDGKARIEFQNAEGGLRLAQGGRNSDGNEFWIAGEDKVFRRANVELGRGGEAWFSHPKVKHPVAIRYGWRAAPAATLFNGAGLPAFPFRTDDWSGPLPSPDDDGATKHSVNDPALKPIFNGKDLSGWVNVNCAPSTFVVQDGMIRCSGFPTGILRTDRPYENFVLEMEWRHLKAGGNAGLFVWSDALTARGVPFSRSVEVQIMDGLEGEGYTSDGDIFAIHGARMEVVNGRGGTSRSFPTEKRMNPSPEWNHYLVTCNNGDISLAVNGKVVTTAKNATPRKGYICLESEGSPIDFRNIRIKELPASTTALPPEHIATVEDGFVPLYNGIDFSGWKFTGAHERHFKAKDWRIEFDGEGEDLWTEKSYKDFTLVCDWRLPGPISDADYPVVLPDGSEATDESGKPRLERVKNAGDSGIYLRGSSKSQINIWCWPVGSGEVHGYRTDKALPGEVRAGVTPKVRADSPLGQWNRFIITMKGDRLTVVLNGKTVIENAHLPGVAAEGPIALQKHGSRIEFANLFIKEHK